MSRPVVDVIELEAWSLRKAGPELIFGRCRHHVDPEGLMYSYEQRLVDLGVTAEELDRNDVWTTLVGPKHDIQSYSLIRAKHCKMILGRATVRSQSACGWAGGDRQCEDHDSKSTLVEIRRNLLSISLLQTWESRDCSAANRPSMLCVPDIVLRLQEDNR